MFSRYDYRARDVIISRYDEQVMFSRYDDQASNVDISRYDIYRASDNIYLLMSTSLARSLYLLISTDVHITCSVIISTKHRLLIISTSIWLGHHCWNSSLYVANVLLFLGAGLDKFSGYAETTSDSQCTQFSSANCEKYWTEFVQWMVPSTLRY